MILVHCFYSPVQVKARMVMVGINAQVVLWAEAALSVCGGSSRLNAQDFTRFVWSSTAWFVLVFGQVNEACCLGWAQG